VNKLKARFINLKLPLRFPLTLAIQLVTLPVECSYKLAVGGRCYGIKVTGDVIVINFISVHFISIVIYNT
jgi:hypothetical protein